MDENNNRKRQQAVLSELQEKLKKAIAEVIDSDGISGELGYVNDRTYEFMANAAVAIFEHSTVHEEWLAREVIGEKF